MTAQIVLRLDAKSLTFVEGIHLNRPLDIISETAQQIFMLPPDTRE